jgi:hypothetical protein
MLLSFFLLFCLIVAGTGYSGWNYYTGATLPLEDLPEQSMVRVHANAGVVYQPKGKTDLITPRQLCADNPADVHDVCFPLEEGYRVRTVPEAGYGPVASIVLPDDTHVDMWAHPSGTDLVLDKYQVTRWNNHRQEVVFRQSAGYARYDVKDGQPYANVSYTIEISAGVRVVLAPGGSYSVNVPHEDPGDALILTQSHAPMLVEVATRSGHAEIQGPNQRTSIGPGLLVQVDRSGVLSAPLPARWGLLRDGDFAAHSSDEYNSHSDTWSVISNSPRLPNERRNGFFTVINGCRPETPDSCPRPAERTTVGQFRREGGQSDQFIIGISQALDVDVSEYTQLHLLSWTRVLTQTVAGAGIQGSECPIFITLVYKPTSPSDQESLHRICVYTGVEAPVKAGYIDYIKMPQFDWQRLDIDLRKISELRSVRYLQQIIIEARGHDYLAEITDISLVGTQ